MTLLLLGLAAWCVASVAAAFGLGWVLRRCPPTPVPELVGRR